MSKEQKYQDPLDYQHLLDGRQIHSIETWEEWQELWTKAETAQELDGLLHWGMKVAMGLEYQDMMHSEIVTENIPLLSKAVCFYLDVTDGYLSIRHFEKANEDRERATLSLYLARKAAKVLSTTFFSGFINRVKPWPHVLLQKEVFSKTLWFFRPSFVNLQPEVGERDEHYIRVITRFAYSLASYIWHFGYFHPGRKISENEFRNVQPQAVELLNRLGKLDFLLGESISADDIGDDVMKKLHELVTRTFKSVDQALLKGDQAGYVYIVLQAKQAAALRQKQTAEA